MPLKIPVDASTLFVRRPAFESAGLTRADIDGLLGLTDEEFRVEEDLIAIGPVFDVAALGDLVTDFEKHGLVYFEDFFELSGNWPGWLSLYVMSRVSEG